MPTQSLTDQLRLLEEERNKRWECTELPVELFNHLLAVAKGLEAELTKAQADLLPHYAAIKAGDKLVDELSKERDALRAEKEELAKLVKYDTEQLAALRAGNERCRMALKTIASMSAIVGYDSGHVGINEVAETALASLSK